MSFFEILNLRYQWEETVKDFKLDYERKEGNIDNITWFIQHGSASNRFRKGYEKAISIAEQIMEKYDEEINLSSLHREKIKTV